MNWYVVSVALFALAIAIALTIRYHFRQFERKIEADQARLRESVERAGNQ